MIHAPRAEVIEFALDRIDQAAFGFAAIAVVFGRVRAIKNTGDVTARCFHHFAQAMMHRFEIVERE